MSSWTPSRRVALEALRRFAPHMGRSYAARRNHDLGQGNHANVSRLSPYVRRRLLTEQELVTAALDHHGPKDCEKFVQEVVWRGYFKGFLERRPEIWTSYRDGLQADLAALDRDAGLHAAITRAETGQTGLECFDAWARELLETGYLHNHARMWFASIWVFTLALPWRLGADFFLRHLLDGDPASNTLGWRWVAGLHTRGKAYQATASNIETFTAGRFSPDPAAFADPVTPLDHMEPDGLPPVKPLRPVTPPAPDRPTALLLTEDDCLPETALPAPLRSCPAATLATSRLRSPRPVASGVIDFERGALSDTASRLTTRTPRLEVNDPADLVAWAVSVGARQVVMPYAPVGPLRDWMRQAATCLQAERIELCEWERDWDAKIWPLATAGFFKVKKRIPDILETLEAA